MAVENVVTYEQIVCGALTQKNLISAYDLKKIIHEFQKMGIGVCGDWSFLDKQNYETLFIVQSDGSITINRCNWFIIDDLKKRADSLVMSKIEDIFSKLYDRNRYQSANNEYILISPNHTNLSILSQSFSSIGEAIGKLKKSSWKPKSNPILVIDEALLIHNGKQNIFLKNMLDELIKLLSQKNSRPHVVMFKKRQNAINQEFIATLQDRNYGRLWKTQVPDLYALFKQIETALTVYPRSEMDVGQEINIFYLVTVNPRSGNKPSNNIKVHKGTLSELPRNDNNRQSYGRGNGYNNRRRYDITIVRDDIYRKSERILDDPHQKSSNLNLVVTYSLTPHRENKQTNTLVGTTIKLNYKFSGALTRDSEEWHTETFKTTDYILPTLEDKVLNKILDPILFAYNRRLIEIGLPPLPGLENKLSADANNLDYLIKSADMTPDQPSAKMYDAITTIFSLYTYYAKKGIIDASISWQSNYTTIINTQMGLRIIEIETENTLRIEKYDGTQLMIVLDFERSNKSDGERSFKMETIAEDYKGVTLFEDSACNKLTRAQTEALLDLYKDARDTLLPLVLDAEKKMYGINSPENKKPFTPNAIN